MITNESKTFFVYKLPLIRGICVLGVILIHTTADFATMTRFGWLGYTLIFLNSLARFAVPLFVVFSGFYLSLNRHNEDAVPFYRRTLRFLIIPYVLYSMFYSILKIGSGGNPLCIITDLPFGSASSHLWFMLLILQLYILHPYLRRWYLACEHRGALVLAVLFLQMAWSILSMTLLPLALSEISISLFPNSTFLASNMVRYGNSIVGFFFLQHLGYFLGGYYLLEHSEELGRLFSRSIFPIIGSIVWVATAIGLAAYLILPISEGIQWNAIEHRSLLHIFITPFLSFAALGTILSIAKKTNGFTGFFNRWFYSIGLYSYGIYYLHIFSIMVFSKIFTYIVNTTSISIASYYFLRFTFVVLITFLTVKILSRSPFGKYVT
jgi:surface polysaccharide O-acyltransferase-like enzyme